MRLDDLQILFFAILVVISLQNLFQIDIVLIPFNLVYLEF